MDNIHLDQDSTWANVINVTDYYPFGLAMEGRTVQDSSYRYGFNGKEHDQNGEWGSKSHYDYGFRIYNPSIAKFLSVDSLASSFPWFTPYQFAGNTPIRALDLDGLKILDYRANFRLNFSKTKIHIVYYAEVLNNLNASQSTGINLKSRTLKTEARELYEGQFLIQEAQRPQSVITEGASIWNDRRADFGPADDTADKFMRFNKNPKPGRSDAMAWLVSNTAIWSRDNLINGKRNRVQAEINQQIESLQKAFSLTELAIHNTGESVMKDNYKHFDISEEAFKVDLASYIFDGTIPKREEGYDAFIKDQGNKI